MFIYQRRAQDRVIIEVLRQEKEDSGNMIDEHCNSDSVDLSLVDLVPYSTPKDRKNCTYHNELNTFLTLDS